jgi:ankyrin repeat protein
MKPGEISLLEFKLNVEVSDLTAVADRVSLNFATLPFQDFENLVRETHPPAMSDSRSIGTRIEAVNPPLPIKILDHGPAVHTEKETYMPATKGQEFWVDHPPSQTSHGHVFPLYRCILFSVSNNFAGMESYSFEETIDYLRKATDVNLYRLISSISCYTGKAITRNLFKGAIEAGDTNAVKFLLSNSAAKINPDLEFCHMANSKWTPIERASALRNLALIKLLLEYHVDVNKSYSKFVPKGALNNAITQVSHKGYFYSIEKYQSVDMEIVELLIHAGGQVDSRTLEFLIMVQDEELFLRIMREFARSQHHAWSQLGIFWFAFKDLSSGACEELVTLLVQVEADLNYNFIHPASVTYPCTIIDMAAGRGDMCLIQTLLGQGAKPTGDTLASAVSSGNLDVVKFLLGICGIDSIGTLGVTPLAAAISLMDSKMIKLLEEHGAWLHLARKDQLTSALRAASTAGDMDILLRLVNLRGKATPDDLGTALIATVRGGHNQAAYVLIDAGANLDIVSRTGGPALLEALQRRDEGLVIRLLDEGANPNYGQNSHDDLKWKKSAIQHAVEWGNHAVIGRLIFERVDVNDRGMFKPAISIAVDNQDKSIVMVLIAAGADLNHPNHQLTQDGPLAIATKKGDIDMVRILLNKGAHSNDSAALKHAAFLGLDDILDLILARHLKDYPEPTRGFGSSILNLTVLQGDESRLVKLLNMGMDPTTFVWGEGQENSPFGTAISHAQPSRDNIVKLFLERSCDPNSIVIALSHQNSQDSAPQLQTALLAAVSTKKKSLVELLVRAGAKVNYPARGGIKRTPIQRAAELDLYEMVEFLVASGADVNAAPASRDGGTALQLAAASGNLRTVQVLLNQKVDVDALSSKVNGCTALEAAADNGRLDTVKLLLKARAIQSKGLDRPQFERAKQHGRRNGHFEVVEMLRDFEAQHIVV